MSMLSDVLDAQAPAAYPDAMMLYGQFVGSWEGEATTYPPEGAAVRHSAEMHFGWVLEGRAVQDVWIVPARRDRRWPLGARNLYGTTLRVYDPAADAWNVTWINPPNGRADRPARRGPRRPEPLDLPGDHAGLVPLDGRDLDGRRADLASRGRIRPASCRTVTPRAITQL